MIVLEEHVDEAIGGGSRTSGRGLGEEHHELVAAEATDEVVPRTAVRRPLGQRSQHCVLGRVAVRVVHFLESVEVDEEDRSETAGVCDRAHQAASVEDAGQVVVRRGPAKLVLRLPPPEREVGERRRASERVLVAVERVEVLGGPDDENSRVAGRPTKTGWSLRGVGITMHQHAR